MVSERSDDDRLDRESEPGTVPLRPVLIVAALLLLAAVAYLTYSCSRAPASGGFTDGVNHYAPGSVAYLASGRSYLVRQEDGSFLALSEVEANADDRVAGCVIRFRPDLGAAGATGVFRDDCHGTLFNRQGIAVQGSSPPMQRHPVSVRDSRLSVQFRSCLSADGTPEACRE